MRLTQHSGRQGSAKHNDRTFDLTQADNIDANEEYKNFYVNANQGKDFKSGELEFYKKHYSEALKLSNEKKIKQRHPEKVRSIKDLYNSSRTRPEELILQIGSVDDEISLDVFEDCALEYIKELHDWNVENGNHMKVMNYAMHYDEATPHLHLRRVWDYTDENGNLQINQNKALELAGVELPNPDAKISRYNNRKMAFDKMMREKWLNICEKHGLKVEREPVAEKKRHLSVKDYKYSQQVESKEIINAVNKFIESTSKDINVMIDKNSTISEVHKAHNNFIESAKSLKDEITDLSAKINESADALDNSLKDFAHMSQARREDERKKQEAKMI